MTGTISKYFPTRGNKRKPSSTSSGDLCVSPEDKEKEKKEHHKKRLRHDSDISDDMAMQEAISGLEAAITKLATKEDIEKLTASFNGRIEQLESCVFELKNERDRLQTEVTKLRGENAELQGRLNQHSTEAANVKRALNDHEQHGRQWNLRVFGVREAQGEESVEDCVKKCTDIFSSKLGVPVSAEDMEMAHRTGRSAPAGGRPRPIIVRFFSRRKRGLVLTARRKLKRSGIVVGEDLTQANYALLKKVNAHSATMSTWSSHGKILTKLKNRK